MARSALLTFILLLTATATCKATRAFTSVSAPAPSAVLMQEEKIPLSPLFTFGGNIKQCFSAVNKVENCFRELLASFLHIHTHVSQDCCHAVSGTRNKCSSLFSPSFRIQLKSACGVVELSASA
jgi:Prolamin-like